MLSSISETQDEDSMPMCLSNSQLESQDVDGMSMCLSNSHCDAVMMGPPGLHSVKERACQPCFKASVASINCAISRPAT